jgi:hypothetical protein
MNRFALISALLTPLAALAALIISWFGGRKAAEAEAKVEELEAHVETRKRMDKVVVGDDPAVLREWLRERGKQRGNL